jgi:hypothetical protein
MQRRDFLALSAALLAPTLPEHSQTVRAFGLEWEVIDAGDWKVTREGAIETLELAVARPQEKNPRAPIQYALARTEPLLRFTMDVEVKPGLDRNRPGHLVVVYAWRDYTHFNYVHLSSDAAREQPVHNGVFHVYGGDRVRISNEEGDRSFKEAAWTALRIGYDASTGLVETWVNGSKNPSLRGCDLSLGAGRIGLGSFFHTGAFRNFRLKRA